MALVFSGLGAGTAIACPFCTAQKPTLNQLRDRAAVVALAEVVETEDGNTARLRAHQVLHGPSRMTAGQLFSAKLDISARPGDLVLLFGGEVAESPALRWHVVKVNETSYAYFARSPSLRASGLDRLAYFADYLEHADPLIAEDAYLEFAHAPFDLVARVSDLLPSQAVRRWLIAAEVPPERKGFFGLVLGLCTPPAERAANAAFLRKLIDAPADDFRAGFDGVLGGYLLLEPQGGIELVEARYLANPKAAEGNVRHAVTALRFYFEYGREIPHERLCRAMRQLLDRGPWAAEAMTDLARWKDWQPVEKIASLYGRADYPQPATRRAVVGYLLSCPGDAAARQLASLRSNDPEGMAEAEAILGRTGSLPTEQ